MSQTSTERLRDYLAQLPPQSQALLMREFERAIERGEDMAVANFVLEQLRKVVRGTEEDDEARPRTDDPARLLYRSAGAVSRREQFSGQGRADPPRIAAADLAMAGPRRRARCRARVRSRARRDQAERQHRRPRRRDPQIPARRGRRDHQCRYAGRGRRQAAGAGPYRPAQRRRGFVVDRRRAAGARDAGYARQPDAGPDAGVCATRRSPR